MVKQKEKKPCEFDGCRRVCPRPAPARGGIIAARSAYAAGRSRTCSRDGGRKIKSVVTGGRSGGETTG